MSDSTIDDQIRDTLREAGAVVGNEPSLSSTDIADRIDVDPDVIESRLHDLRFVDDPADRVAKGLGDSWRVNELESTGL